MGHSNINIVVHITPLSGPKQAYDYVLCQDLCCPFSDLEAMLTSKGYNYSNNSRETRILPNAAESVSTDLGYNNHLSLDYCQCFHDALKFPTKSGVLKLQQDTLFFNCMISEMRRSMPFRQNMLLTIFRCYRKKFKHRETSAERRKCPICWTTVWKIRVFVFLDRIQNEVDKIWNQKIQVLVYEKCELESAMAWLSTLGGAFSSLGDAYLECAEKAGVISIRQLQIALRLGDPLTICRCKIYIAMSLLQQGYYKETKHLIRKLYEFSVKGQGKNDFRLKNMCMAVWNRLKYMLYIQKNEVHTSGKNSE